MPFPNPHQTTAPFVCPTDDAAVQFVKLTSGTKSVDDPPFLSLASSNMSALTEEVAGFAPTQLIRRGQKAFKWPPHENEAVAAPSAGSQSTRSSPGSIDSSSGSAAERYSKWRENLKPLCTHLTPPDAIGRVSLSLFDQRNPPFHSSEWI